MLQADVQPRCEQDKLLFGITPLSALPDTGRDTVLGCSWEWFEQRACLLSTGEDKGFLRLPQGHWQSLDVPLRETACGSQHLPMGKGASAAQCAVVP